MITYTVGVDFGTLSARAVLVEAQTGKELSTSVMAYPHGVIEKNLPVGGAPLPADSALEDPRDYEEALAYILSDVMRKAGVPKEKVVGVGVDFTCCTLLPLDAAGTPLCYLPAFRENPHAYPKLWKDHSAKDYAARLTAVAKERGEAFLSHCGGSISPEWLFPKVYEVLDLAPDVYAAADTFLEAGDYITFLLTGERKRGYLYAAYKAQYEKEGGYPDEAYFAAVDERLTHVVKEKFREPVVPAGTAVGRVTKEAAARFGLAEGTVVASAMPDAHVAAGALGICSAGDAFMVLGTSGCFYVMTEEYRPVKGICGTVMDGIIPGFWGHEAGLCCFGDHFAYAAEHLTSPAYVKEAEERNIPMLRLLIEKAAKKRPGEGGVIALNWWNGNRNPFADSALTGLFVGMTLHTAPEDLMRALIEANAFGTRLIFEHFEKAQVPIRTLVASGGIARKDPFTMQLFADVLQKEIRIADTKEAPAHGSAVTAAIAAGVHKSYRDGVKAMSAVGDTVYRPNPAAAETYDILYREYCRLADCFGGGENTVMKTLRRMSAEKRRG